MDNLGKYINLIKKFCVEINKQSPLLSGAPSSKDIGHYLSERLRKFLERELNKKIRKGSFGEPDLPEFNTDVKATLYRSEKGQMQWQSSYPYSSPLDVIQLPTNLLLFVYEYIRAEKGIRVKIKECFYIPQETTGNHKINEELRRLVEQAKKGKLSKEDACKILAKKIEEKLKGRVKVTGENFEKLTKMFERALKYPPSGVLTIAGALQWRMQYGILSKKEKRKELENKGVVIVFEEE